MEMTKKEAIELLNERHMTMSMCLDKDYCAKQNAAIAMAIAALRVDSADIINRQKAEIEQLKVKNEILIKNADTAFQDGLNEAQDLYASQIRNEVKQEDNIVPDVEQVKHGEWKPIERLWEYSHQWQCTKCGNPVLTDRYLYCPYCGAKMDGKER